MWRANGGSVAWLAGTVESLRREDCANRTKLNRRKTLAIAARAEKPAARKIAIVGPLPPEGPAKPKTNATKADREQKKAEGQRGQADPAEDAGRVAVG